MKRTINVLMLFFLFLIGEKVHGQELEHVVPLSPKEASKAKCVKVLANHFAGKSSIGNPI